MSIFHKILVALIFLTIPFNFFFACRALKTHQVWRDQIAKLKSQIAQVEKESYELEHGVFDEKTGEVTTKGIRQLVCELDSIMFQRGRAWFEAIPDKIEPNTGRVALQVLAPSPHNIVPGTILYCFDAAPCNQGGCYIGKFTVTEAEDSQIEIRPCMEITQSESEGFHPNQRLEGKLTSLNNKGPDEINAWNLYEKMPRDEHAMYAKMDEEKIRELMPESTASEFINDGKDDPDRPGMKFERKLRDYERIFDAVSSKSAKLDDLIVAATFDAAYANSALEDAKGLQTAQENLKKQMADQLDTVRAERDAIAAHLKMLNARYQLYVDKIQKVRAENIKLAKQIDAAQREAAKRIYARARANGVASAL